MATEGLAFKSTILILDGLLTPGAIDFFLNTEQNRKTGSLCKPPEALSSHLEKVRRDDDLGITDMKE